ncbi:MAG: bifunctional 23S rRNA (guanine(2069)-N(7))-methyltransferase RlmK/23S rRNA (guanine(2445)-N(2))-methyltransferase RlmL [Legionellales bacterium]|nr:bifunctional 23S rRNA (guanine(2069)-N(7))-methyltransferase RlmK/23S rRNA (guanine(2445)-N(2))-methyltransferase RlmL [Legionellales bacterium]
MRHAILVTCPKGLEYLLAEELAPWDVTQVKLSPQGMTGLATLEAIYQISLWSRIANRVLLHLFTCEAPDPKDLLAASRQFAWQTVFDPQSSMAIHFQGHSETIRNAMFGAQVIKDGLVDYCRDHGFERPTIDRESADIRLRAYLKQDSVSVYLDLVGYSLHQRGYRLAAGEAPLKETVAAAMLMRAKWASRGADDGFLDPCCGSGTLVIEAAMIAARMAPGLLRQDQAFAAWSGHDATLWEACREQAAQQQIQPTIRLRGSDSDPRVVAKAEENAWRAGVAAFTDWSVQAIDPNVIHADHPQGLVLCNPPYGERIGDEDSLLPLYETLGTLLHRGFANWQVGILTSSPRLAKATGLRSHKQYRFYNGPIACYLYCIDLHPHNRLQSDAPPKPLSESAQMFANRLLKNYKHLRSWAQRTNVTCYRVYDADLPEYAYAIDLYQDHAVLQEYAPPATVDEAKAEQRRQDVLRAVPEVLQLPATQIVVKQRVRQRGTQQYEKLAEQRQWMTVTEGQAKLRVNLHDYLDTGLFLDHRLLRLRFAKLQPGTRFLNCFCYTASASVHAALAGALTTNVDLSQTYLTWAEENFRLNGLPVSKHQFVHYDCLEWLQVTKDRFDVIFLDPPSFSNSKRMQQTLDVERDHEQLIRACMLLLTEKGTLYFSTNLRRFALSPSISEDFTVQDMTAETIDIDFKRNPKIHQCYMLKK